MTRSINGRCTRSAAASSSVGTICMKLTWPKVTLPGGRPISSSRFRICAQSPMTLSVEPAARASQPSA